jgi:hypothetical protein
MSSDDVGADDEDDEDEDEDDEVDEDEDEDDIETLLGGTIPRRESEMIGRNEVQKRRRKSFQLHILSTATIYFHLLVSFFTTRKGFFPSL